MKKYYVYIITNTIENKQYVGSRITNKENVYEDNYWGSSKYLNEDIKIYGNNNFIKEILCDNYTNKNEMLDGEAENIFKYNTLFPNGYNRYIPNKYPGFHREGCNHTEESKKLISERTKEEMKKINLSGKNNPMYNKSVYDIWVKKYGEEVANEKYQAMIINLSSSRKGKHKLSDKKMNEIKDLLNANVSVKEIIKKYNISLSTVYKYKSKWNL